MSFSKIGKTLDIPQIVVREIVGQTDCTNTCVLARHSTWDEAVVAIFGVAVLSHLVAMLGSTLPRPFEVLILWRHCIQQVILRSFARIVDSNSD